MVIVKSDLHKLIKWFRNQTDKSVEQMRDELQKRIKRRADALGIGLATMECDYCGEGRISSRVSGRTEKCFVIYNPEHSAWMRVVCTLYRMGNVNYYEFYKLADSVKLPLKQTESAVFFGRLFHHSERDQKYWEEEITRIIKDLGK